MILPESFADSHRGDSRTRAIKPAPVVQRGQDRQYSEASMIVSTRTVCLGSAGSSLPMLSVRS